MKKIAIITFLASVLQVMNTYLLFPLFVTHLVIMGGKMGLNFINTHLLMRVSHVNVSVNTSLGSIPTVSTPIIIVLITKAITPSLIIADSTIGILTKVIIPASKIRSHL